MTADSNVKNQQNISDRHISIVVVRAFNNRLSTHIEMIADITRVLSEIKSGEIREVFHPEMAN